MRGRNALGVRSACHACPPTNRASVVRGCLSVIGDASITSLVSHTDNCY